MYRPLWAQYINTMLLQWHHMSIRVFEITGTQLFVQQLILVMYKENIKVPVVPLTKSQQWGSFLHVQGSFFVSTQPMRNDRHIHKMITACHDLIISYHNGEIFKNKFSTASVKLNRWLCTSVAFILSVLFHPSHHICSYNFMKYALT